MKWYKITSLPAYTYWIAAERSGFAVCGIPNERKVAMSESGVAVRVSFHWTARVAGKTYEGDEPSIDASREAAENAFLAAEKAIGWANL